MIFKFVSIVRSSFVILISAACLSPITALFAVESDSNALAGKIDELLRGFYLENEPGASVAVSVGGKKILSQGYGLANLEWAIPNGASTVFRLSSITKQFTAAAILILVEEGKISLEDPIEKYFPNYPHSRDRITIEHLLHHTSGIRSYTKLGHLNSIRRITRVDEIIGLFNTEPLNFEPGEEWRYSDSGYILLGAIIEKLSGLTYEDFVAERIFSLLSMENSYYERKGSVIPRKASGYRKVGGRFEKSPHVNMDLPYSAGSLVSTVNDLTLWATALTSGKVLSRGMVKKSFEPARLNNGVSTNYGYGWAISDYYDGHKIVEHGGTISGFRSHILLETSRGIVVVILSNCEGRSLDPSFLATRILGLIIGVPDNLPYAALAENLAEEYLGIYRFKGKIFRDVTFNNEGLHIQRTGGRKYRLIPLSDAEFSYVNSVARIRFERNSNRNVIYMILNRRYGPLEIGQRVGE